MVGKHGYLLEYTSYIDIISTWRKCIVIVLNSKIDGFVCPKHIIHRKFFSSNHFMLQLNIVHICCHLSSSFFIARFSVKLQGQQLEIKPPLFTVFRRLHHFARVKSQAISSKILNVIGPTSSRSSNWSFLICFWQVKLVWGVFF